MNLQGKTKQKVVVVTKDINFRVKCDALSILAEDYYKDKIIENVAGSFQENNFLDYGEMDDDFDIEKKAVKIINNNEENTESFEDNINKFIHDNRKNIKIFDIKYIKNSVLIIYELNNTGSQLI